jgi:pyruvate/2-oxoglutarate dehydrogenase complex dihydrolipoamide dehydrogenase (E3) component
VAREHGHEVTLLEAQGHLGGRLSLADRPCYRREVGAMLTYLRRRLAAAGVTVRLEMRASVDDVKRLAPDCVVVATGARFALPAVEGASAPHVQAADRCLASRPPGAGGAVVLGSGRIACDAALHLSECGWDVTALVAERDVARDVESVTRKALVGELGRAGVRVVTGARVDRIADRRVHFRDGNGQDGHVPAALVVAAGAVVPDDDLARALADAGFAVHRVGDCAEPGSLGAAIHGATDVTRRL